MRLSADANDSGKIWTVVLGDLGLTGDPGLTGALLSTKLTVLDRGGSSSWGVTVCVVIGAAALGTCRVDEVLLTAGSLCGLRRTVRAGGCGVDGRGVEGGGKGGGAIGGGDHGGQVRH